MVFWHLGSRRAFHPDPCQSLRWLTSPCPSGFVWHIMTDSHWLILIVMMNILMIRITQRTNTELCREWSLPSWSSDTPSLKRLLRTGDHPTDHHDDCLNHCIMIMITALLSWSFMTKIMLKMLTIKLIKIFIAQVDMWRSMAEMAVCFRLHQPSRALGDNYNCDNAWWG